MTRTERHYAARCMFLVISLSAVVDAVGATPFQAWGKNAFTQEEYRSLPRVCLAQPTIHKRLHPPMFSKAEQRQFREVLGNSYRHYHHYCWGLLHMRRAAADATRRQFSYRSAVGDFEYVIRNSTEDFPLLPEVYLRKGMALRFLDNHGAAASDFLSAIRIKPDYTPAYAALIDLHVDLGDVGSAARVLDLGLRNAPDSTILKQKKTELEALGDVSRE